MALTSDFPTSIPSYNEIGTANKQNEAGYDHRTIHNQANADIIALSTKLGIDGDTGTATHSYKLSDTTGTAKALSNVNPTITGSLNGNNNTFAIPGSPTFEGTPKIQQEAWIQTGKNVKVYTGTADATNPTRSGYITARSLRPTVSNGCGTVTTVQFAGSGTADEDLISFVASADTYCSISFTLPASWDNGTISMSPDWIPAAGTTSQTVIWAADALKIGDAGTLSAARGTQGTVTDAWQGVNLEHHAGSFDVVPASNGGTPYRNFNIRFGRLGASDNLAGTAYLKGILFNWKQSKYSDD